METVKPTLVYSEIVSDAFHTQEEDITPLIYQNVMTRLLPSTAKLQLFVVHVNRVTIIIPIIFN